jgi:hypothetical protein
VRLLLALIACLGAILACGPEPPDTGAHPFSEYDVQVELNPSGAGATEQLEFLVYYQGEVLHLPDKTESIVCDGVTLKVDPDEGIFLDNAPLKAPGAEYDCAFMSHGKAAALVIPAIAPISPETPTSGAALSRQAGFTVRYAPGSSIDQITVQARLSDQSTILCVARQTGPETFVVDSQEALRKAPPGPGFLDFFTQVKRPIAKTGGVHSLVATYHSFSTIAVPWV